MELNTLRVFLAVANEGSFSRAATRLGRTQPAVSLALQRLETELGERLLDRSAREVVLTDAGKAVLDYARRFDSLESELTNAIQELRDHSAGTLTIGANESSSLYLLRHIERYRILFPKVSVRIRRSMSSTIPDEIINGNLELGVISYQPSDERLHSTVIYADSLVFVVSPKHRLASRKAAPIAELGGETFIAHNVRSPYRERVIREFRERAIPLRMDIEMPTVETIRWMVERNLGVAFLPRMCVEAELAEGRLKAVKVPEMQVERKIYLVQPGRRAVSYAAEAFLKLLQATPETGPAAKPTAGTATSLHGVSR
jgi:DNA-binding transcriptional LysR family regulator